MMVMMMMMMMMMMMIENRLTLTYNPCHFYFFSALKKVPKMPESHCVRHELVRKTKDDGTIELTEEASAYY